MDQTPQPEAVNSPSPATPTVPQVVIQQGRSSFLLRLFAFFGWAGFVFCGLLVVGLLVGLGQYFDTSEGITEKFHSGSKFAADKIAIIRVSGVIVDGDGYVKRQISRVSEDDRVKAVVVRIESPGGTITGSDYIYHHLNKLREERSLPMVVSMGSIAASGGYYVAMAVGDQEDSIFAEPTTTTGSIGVIIPHYDVSGLMERLDVKDDSIATHPRKQMLSMTRPITPDHREIIEEYLRHAFERFKDIVKSGRPELREDTAKLEELATGEIFTALQAQESGLIDRIGFIEAAIQRAATLANLDIEKTRVVEFEQPVSLLGLSGLASAGRGSSGGFVELLERSVPRAYYLFTALPPLATSYSLRDGQPAVRGRSIGL